MSRSSHIRSSQHLRPCHSSANRFALLRLENSHAQGTFNQLRVALLHGLTYKLFSLYNQIEGIKLELEVRSTLPSFITQLMTAFQVEIDKQQLNTVEVITNAVTPSPTDSEHIS